jgi:hypothetical protein
MASDKRVGRPEAMRQSMLALIDQEDAEETHPAFGAPFVVAGDAQRRQDTESGPVNLNATLASPGKPA